MGMKRSRWIVLAVALMVVLAACTSDDGADTTAGGGDTATTAGDTTTTAGDGDGATETTESVDLGQGADLTFFVITHGDAGVFWTVAQNGAEDAGELLGVEVKYQGSANDPELQAQMIEAAISENPDGIAISLPNPDALADPVRRAVDAGIPVYTLNSGLNNYRELGAVTHIGQTEIVAGNGAGLRFNDLGGTKALCIIHEEGNIALEERCDGLEETFNGEVVRLNVTGDADIPASTAETTATLLADQDIDVVLAAGPTQALVAVEAVATVGTDIVIGNFDLSGDVVDAIIDGKISFAIDQQQYLQGFLPVVFMYLQATNANTVGGGLPILTGPGFVTIENAALVKDLAEAGTR